MIKPWDPTGDDTSEGAIIRSFKGGHFGRDIILTCVRWYLAYPLSCRQLEELMQDHATTHRWVLKYTSVLRNNCILATTHRWVLKYTSVLRNNCILMTLDVRCPSSDNKQDG